jgi:succinate-acetate transporter protein
MSFSQFRSYFILTTCQPNVIVGMAFGVGGLTQLLAGMWEFGAGNTFGATGECFETAVADC